jgi:hypothetical protein
MGSAARGVFAVACVALLGLAGGASAQVLPIPVPPPPPPPDLPDLPPTPPVPPVPTPGPVDPPPVGNPTAPTAPSAGTNGSSEGGTNTSGSRKDRKAGSRASRKHTRFDRLPRRVEALLERIAAGRHSRGDLARLERLLASMSPGMRARVLRLVRAEIRQLRGGSETAAERRRIRRLQSVIEILRSGETRSIQGTQLEAPQPSTPSVTATDGTDPTAAPAPSSSSSSQAQPPTSRGSLPAREGDSGRNSDRSIFGLPASRWEIPLGVFIAFALLFVLSLGALVLAVAPPRTLPAGRLREVMKLQRAEVGFTGATTLAGLTLLLALTLLLGAPL